MKGVIINGSCQISAKEISGRCTSFRIVWVITSNYFLFTLLYSLHLYKLIRCLLCFDRYHHFTAEISEFSNIKICYCYVYPSLITSAGIPMSVYTSRIEQNNGSISALFSKPFKFVFFWQAKGFLKTSNLFKWKIPHWLSLSIFMLVDWWRRIQMCMKRWKWRRQMIDALKLRIKSCGQIKCKCTGGLQTETPFAKHYNNILAFCLLQKKAPIRRQPLIFGFSLFQ